VLLFSLPDLHKTFLEDVGINCDEALVEDSAINMIKESF